MSLTMLDRLQLAILQPSPESATDWVFDPASVAPRAEGVTNGIFVLGADVPLRIQVGGTCAGNAVAQAIEIGHTLLREPCLPVSGSGCWAQGQLFTAPEHAHVDAGSGAFVQRVIQAARAWGWPFRAQHPEDPLVELGADALGEITARAKGSTVLEYELVKGSFLGLGASRLDHAEQALRDLRPLITAGIVDDGFAAAQPGSVIVAPVGDGGGHALCIDAVQWVGGQRIWGVRDTWGRGLNRDSLAEQRLWATDGWMESRWEIWAARVVLR